MKEEKYRKFYSRQNELIEKRLKLMLIGREPRSVYEPCAYILESGGKHLRPFLVLISAMAVGGNYKTVFNSAVAVELLHNFTLVHDDIMDNSNKRRGRVTLHKKYDISTAILAGDSLIALAYENLLKDSKSNVINVVSTFTQGIVEVCEGQSMDKEFEIRSDVALNEYMKMIYKKTAALAQMCCSIGAQLGGATKKQIEIASDYGKYLGMAFQIQDDLLDIMAKENELGKSVGSDLIEGKKTFLFLKAVEKAKGKDRADLLNVMKWKGVQKSEIDRYRDLYLKLGVIYDAEQEIMKYTKLAVKNLSRLPNQDGINIMNWLANILISRSK